MDTDDPGVTVIGLESKMNTDAAARRGETHCHQARCQTCAPTGKPAGGRGMERVGVVRLAAKLSLPPVNRRGAGLDDTRDHRRRYSVNDR